MRILILTVIWLGVTSACEHKKIDAGEALAGMVWIEGGQFMMGRDDPDMPDAQPVHQVTVDGFWMDRTEVTNQEFALFVEATGYKTIAERPLSPEEFPNADPQALAPGSVVFSPPQKKVTTANYRRWWQWVPGANWRHPEGPGTDLKGREKHPVVHVAWEDAVAYAKWANKRLPTEAEWEYASKAGKTLNFIWGNEKSPQGQWLANIWQGEFPHQNLEQDGYFRTAPVASFPANGFGLHDMAGNVWEWCADWYRHDYFTAKAQRNPQGPPDSFDPMEPNIPKKVQKGGSFLCSDNYCVRYLPGSRGKGAVDTGTSNTGFRCVRSAQSAD